MWQKYFSHNELACRCCNILQTEDGFLDKLLELREAWGKPMIVNSCCRCQKNNDAAGGKPKSFHLFGHPELTGLTGTCAIDIGTANMRGDDRWQLAFLAMGLGWSVGVAKTFLHFDRRADYKATGFENPILFTY